MDKKIVLLGGQSDSSYIIANELLKHFKLEKIIIESPVSKKEFIKKRIKKLGLTKVIGQIAFIFLILPFLKRKGKLRINNMLNNLGLDKTSHKLDIEKVDSANSDTCIDMLKAIQPDIVVVNGTRILSKKVLQSVSATFINMHAGITPKYRGVHGAYWALVNNDTEHCGVTVHLVDPGIDTGGIIYQTSVEISAEDNFYTYPFLQLIAGLPLLKKAIQDLQNNQLEVKTSNLDSKLFTHPTFFEYIANKTK